MRILIVEDEQKVSSFLEKGFKAEAFSVDTASTGPEGLQLAAVNSYDVIVLDIMLPGMDGLSLLKRLRESGNPTPVLVLSAKSQLEDRVEGLNSGADDYLPKPFAFTEVLARVRALLRRGSTEVRTTMLTAADLSLDLVTRRVRRGQREIQLTNKEFELLEYLMRNRGKVLSRVILTEHIWDMHFDSETNIVDVVINRLRRKIDDESEVKLIQTVRGVGYVLREGTDETPGRR
jgi:heavy metal response regulator